MLIRELKNAKDQYFSLLAQRRNKFSHYTRDTYFTWFNKEKGMSLAEKAKAKAAAIRAGKKSTPAKSVKPSTAKKSSGKAAKVKQQNRQPRMQIKDAKGRIVTGRDNSFKCPKCGAEITGPWSYKMHLVKQHDFSRKQAGLREEK